MSEFTENDVRRGHEIKKQQDEVMARSVTAYRIRFSDRVQRMLCGPLAQMQETVMNDADKWESVSKIAWYASGPMSNGGFYAGASITGKGVYLHRILTNPPPKMHVDHLNHNGLDNRLSNLRVCTPSQNHGNRKRTPGCSSEFKGVMWDKSKKKWMARITVNYRGIFLGRYKTEEEAADAYDAAAIKYFGEFAHTNAAYRSRSTDTADRINNLSSKGI